MAILVTGAGGFVGAALIDDLRKRGETVITVQRPGAEADWTMDLASDHFAEQLREHDWSGIDTVVHLASIAHRSDTSADGGVRPQAYEKVIVDATRCLARASVDAGVKRFVYMSSVKAEAGSDPYSNGKRHAEALLREFSDTGMIVTVLRAPLIYGAGVKGNLAAMIRGIQAGWFPPMPAATGRRSMAALPDVVEALMLLCKANLPAYSRYTVCDDHSYTARELYESLCRAGNRRPGPSWITTDWYFRLASVCEVLGLGRLLSRSVLHKLFDQEVYSNSELKALGWRGRYQFNELAAAMMAVS